LHIKSRCFQWCRRWFALAVNFLAGLPQKAARRKVEDEANPARYLDQLEKREEATCGSGKSMKVCKVEATQSVSWR
jgi:hypothetical protein